jgi:hypothetical protein
MTVESLQNYIEYKFTSLTKAFEFQIFPQLTLSECRERSERMSGEEGKHGGGFGRNERPRNEGAKSGEGWVGEEVVLPSIGNDNRRLGL